MRSDHHSDPAMCLTSVAFLPDDIAQAIHQDVVQPLRAIEPDHHYYAAGSMHMTIKNVRTIHNPPSFSDDDVTKVKLLFAELIPLHRAVTFSLEELVPFATSVSLIAYADAALKDLVQSLDAGLKRIGIPDNKQYVSSDVFFGNATLCRYTRQPSERYRAALAEMAHVYQAVMTVEVVHLITCNSVCNPETRKVLGSYELGGTKRS
jgi:2'-5' RNA ligase